VPGDFPWLLLQVKPPFRLPGVVTKALEPSDPSALRSFESSLFGTCNDTKISAGSFLDEMKHAPLRRFRMPDAPCTSARRAPENPSLFGFEIGDELLHVLRRYVVEDVQHEVRLSGIGLRGV
jgi:hypothetical protein